MYDFYIGIDIGTSSTKGILIDSDGKIVKQASVSHEYIINGEGLVEQSPDIYWIDFKQVLSMLRIHGKVNAISVTGLSPCIVPVDRKGIPVRNSILYMDRRAWKEAQLVQEHFGRDELLKLTGNRADPFFGGYKLIWMIKNEPDKYARTWKVLDPAKYVIYKLTGKAIIDPVTASMYAPYFDINNNEWSGEVFSEGMDRLPDIIGVEQEVGQITNMAAAEIGLAAGTPVVNGSSDATMAAYSCGVTGNGDSCIIYGSTGLWMSVTDNIKYDDRLVNTRNAFGNGIMVSGGVLTFGSLLEWFSKNVAHVSLKKLDSEASKLQQATGIISLPYFMGERTPVWDPRIRGAILGISLSHSREHLYMALVESTALALKQNIDIASEIGVNVKEAKITGGGANSRLWRQVISDITGIRQLYLRPNAGSAFGSAFLAGAWNGEWNFFDIKKQLKVAEVIDPCMEKADFYTKLYSKYLKLYPAIKNISDD